MAPEDSKLQCWPPRADGRLVDWPQAPQGERDLFALLRRLCEEGLEICARLEKARGDAWSSFVPAEYEEVLSALMKIRDRGGRFLELGSGVGVIAIMVDLLGLESYGIEIAPELSIEARALAARYGSRVRFATGSYIPEGYQWVSDTGDTRMSTVAIGESAYPALGRELADFDWVYAYPWPGEADILRDLVRRRGAPGTQLLLHGYTGGIEFSCPGQS